MPLVTKDSVNKASLIPSTGVNEQPSTITNIRISEPKYSGVEVDTRYTPKAALLAYVQGTPWTVDYFSQVITKDSQLSGQQSTVSAVYQQYQRIVDFEIKVTTPLTSTQDEASNEETLSGAANLYSLIIPNEGDMFVGDIGQGRRGIFKITSCVKKSIFRESAYEIAYDLDSANTIRLQDLIAKTVKTVYFHKDFLNFGQNPLLTAEAHNLTLQAHDVASSMLRQYFKKFYNNEYKTMTLPGQSKVVYDSYLLEFMLGNWTAQDVPQIREIRNFGTRSVPALSATTVLDALKAQDISLMNEAVRQVGLYSVARLWSQPQFNGIRYSGMQYLVYPLDSSVIPQSEYPQPPLVLDAVGLVPSSVVLGIGFNNQAVIGEGISSTTPSALLAIKPVTVDNYYIFSQDFYDRTQAQSALEALVWQFLRKEALDAALLVRLAKTYTQWGLLEQYYYCPIVLMLLRSILYQP